MKKVLFAANLDSFFIKFLIPYLKFFKDKKYEIHLAAKEDGSEVPYYDKKFDIDFPRSINIKQIIRSYKQMKELFKNEHYDIIFCHTPFGAAITRFAAKKYRENGTKVIYIAHGFHFFKGAPLFNWLTFYPVEKYLSKHTDILLTMNKEDHNRALKKFKKTKVKYMPGIGLDVSKFDFEMSEEEKQKLKQSFGFSKDDFIGIYAAELIKGKRQIWLLDSLKEVINENPKIHILLPGKDSMNGYCEEYIKKLSLTENIHLLGFRSDIPKLLKIANIAVSSSKREGLPLNIMEAMYCGLPVVACNCRGAGDLIQNNKNGYLVPLDDQKMFADKVLEIYEGKKFKNIEKFDKKIINNFSINNAVKEFYENCKEYID